MFVFDSFPKLTFLASNLNPLITDYGYCFFIPKAHLGDFGHCLVAIGIKMTVAIVTLVIPKLTDA